MTRSILPPRLAGPFVLMLLGLAAVAALSVEHFTGAEGLSGGALSVSKRSHLSVCVQAEADLVLQQADIDTVGRALEEVRLDADYPREYGVPETVAGCPRSALIEGPVPQSERERHEALSNAVGIVEAEDVSQHRAFVYVLPESVFNDYFGDARYAKGTAEMLCQGHVCGEVTTSLYLPANALDDTVQEGLERALGTYSLPLEPTPDLTPCVQPDPPYWCRGIPPSLLP